MSFEDEFKAIKMLQDDSNDINESHKIISSSIESLKERIAKIAKKSNVDLNDSEISARKKEVLKNLSSENPLQTYSADFVFEEANTRYSGKIETEDILSPNEQLETDSRVNSYISEFNKEYNLDEWDYAIAGGCAIFAILLDYLCIRSSLNPLDRNFLNPNKFVNIAVKTSFDKIVYPELREKLKNAYNEASADVSSITHLVDAPSQDIDLLNISVKELARDPVLGVIFGITDERFKSSNDDDDELPSQDCYDATVAEDNVFVLIGRMFGHFVSLNDSIVNNFSETSIPSPLLGVVRMFNDIRLGSAEFDNQIEYMYTNGYDPRLFVTNSIPCLIMEVLMRVFWGIKQKELKNIPFGESLLDTMPSRINPRFRMMLFIGYGVICGVNFGKIYITHNIMQANRVAWIGFAWNTFHSFKWFLCDKEFKKWNCVEQAEIDRISKTIDEIDRLEKSAESLPT